jgi:hypothetical protein
MIIPIAALVILLFFATLEYYFGERRKSWTAYIAWYLVIVGSMYFAKGYCDECHLCGKRESYIKDWRTLPEYKFVPKGTPERYINEDDSISEVCLKIIRGTDRSTAWASYEIHKDKGQDFYEAAEKSTWYFPKLSDRETAKMVFLSAAAAIPGPPNIRLVAATIALCVQYGLCCIDEYYDMEYNLNMSKFHYRMADAFYEHIQANGW